LWSQDFLQVIGLGDKMCFDNFSIEGFVGLIEHFTTDVLDGLGTFDEYLFHKLFVI
jgi:hypothetical protein